MNLKNLRTNILIILSLISMLLFTFVEYYQYKENINFIYNSSVEKLLIFTKTMRTFDKIQNRLYRAKFTEMQNDTLLKNIIISHNTTEIQKEVQRYSRKLFRETASLKHILVYTKNGKIIEDFDAHDTLGSLQNSRSEHLNVNNYVLQESMKTKSFQQGYVELANHRYYASLVSPFFHNNQVIAYVEFDLKADSLFQLASKAAKYKYGLYLKNPQKQHQKRVIGKLFTSNSNAFEELNLSQKFVYKYANKNIILSHNNKKYFLQQYDIESSFQKDFAQVVLLLDITHHIQNYNATLSFNIKLYFIVMVLVILFIYLILTKLMDNILEEESKLLLKKEELEIILNNSNNFVILFDNSKLILANETMLSFCGYTNNMNGFLKNFANISSIFEEVDGAFSPQKQKDNLTWMEELKNLDEESKIVAIKNKNLELHYFNVKITNLPHKKDSFVVIFSDITSFLEKSKKESYMAYHDNLTKIYNRYYFNEFINKTLYQVQESTMSSLLMIDIDFFKKVNDTYGHQTGDDVLIRFAKTLSLNIRENDTLARWGGEEFIILLLNTNASQAFKIAQNLREKIANVDFKKAGSLTCSIGLSQMKPKDNANSWIARADKALYMAKESGRNKVEAL